MGVGRQISGWVLAGALGLACSAWAPTASAQAAKPAKGAAAKGGDAKDKDTAGKDAGGKPDLAAAKKHFGEGDKKFKAGDFAGALTEFKAANDIKAAPQAERYIGMCEDSLGHYSAAVEWYEKFLAHVPEKMKDQGDEIKKREGEIKALPGKVHFDSVPPGADVTVDGKPQASPTPLDAELPAGIHKVVFTAKGHVMTSKAVDVEFASTQTISATLEAEAAPPPPPPPAPGGGVA
ncbi:MAG: PEGA domain-containing protein, partial [Polyangiaceae bacterium]